LGVASDNNSLTSAGGPAFDVRVGLWKPADSNGNTLTKTDSNGTISCAWDFENRLTSATLPGSGGTVAFKYDPLGRRIYKSSSGGISIYAYDGRNLIEETNSSGAVVERYSQGEDIDEPLAMLRSGATSYYHADGLGSVTSLTNSSGAAKQTYTYDSFGKITASAGSVTNPFRYTGREMDSETGLYYYRARYNDAIAGRFIAEDSILLFGNDVDFYRYASIDLRSLLIRLEEQSTYAIVHWISLFLASWIAITILFVYAKKPIPRRTSLRRCPAYSRVSLSILWNLGSNRLDRGRFVFCVERVLDFWFAVSGIQRDRINQFQTIHIAPWPEDMAFVLSVFDIHRSLVDPEAVQPSGWANPVQRCLVAELPRVQFHIPDSYVVTRCGGAFLSVASRITIVTD
jgi:RHS repeat-associated protein